MRRPYNRALDEALEKGESRIGLGGGLYLRRISRELAGAFTVVPERLDVFRVTRTEEAVQKVSDSGKFAHYKRLGRRWNKLI